LKKLAPLAPVPTYLGRFTDIRDRKHQPVRAVLATAHGQISAQYQAFELAAASKTIQSLQPDVTCAGISDALRACYEGPTSALKDLKAAITSAQPPRLLKYCPMCGTTTYNTFDHYAPIIRFPEFAVHPLNLIPCCSACNSKKSDDWLDSDGNRQYFHAYTDSHLDFAYLTVTLHEKPGYKAVGATFSLAQPGAVDNNTWKLIETHYERLHLLDRYTELSNDEIVEILSNSRIYLETGGRDIRSFLAKQSADREEAHGKNHWRAVLIKMMAGHAHLENWIHASRSSLPTP